MNTHTSDWIKVKNIEFPIVYKHDLDLFDDELIKMEINAKLKNDSCIPDYFPTLLFTYNIVDKHTISIDMLEFNKANTFKTLIKNVEYIQFVSEKYKAAYTISRNEEKVDNKVNIPHNIIKDCKYCGASAQHGICIYCGNFLI